MKRYRIKDICDTNQNTLSSKNEITEIEYLDTGSITENMISETQILKRECAPSRAQRLVKNNTIIYSSVRPNLKHYGILKNPPSNFIVSTGFITLDIKNEMMKEIEPEYLFYLLTQNSITYYLHSIGQNSVSSYPSINSSDIENLSFSFPDLSEQQRIAKILSTIDAKIELNKKISRELEAMAKELYDYWFVQFDFPNEQGKPYKSSGGKMVWNETLKREIPEGWEVKKLGDCLEHINTGLNPRDNFKLGNGNIKYVTVKNIAMDGSIDFSGCDYINEEARKMIHARSRISKGDILFASISPLGRCFILHEEPKDWDINESVFSIRPRSIINSEYLYEYFRSEWFIKKSEKVATGSIFSGIRIQVLTSLPILIPDQSIIGDFSTKLSNLLCQKEKFSQENMTLTNLRNQLLPLLMNGQVRVSEEKGASVSQKDDTNRFILWKNTYPVAARGEKNDTVLRAMYDAMDDEDK